jgi:hypothetical protein
MRSDHESSTASAVVGAPTSGAAGVGRAPGARSEASTPGRGATYNGGASRSAASRRTSSWAGSSRLVRSCQRTSVAGRTKEPRGSRSAMGEVELPPGGAEAARTQSQRELQSDAEGPTTTSGTHEATSPRMLNVRGSDPRSPPNAGSAATSSIDVQRRGTQRSNGHPSYLEQPLFVSLHQVEFSLIPRALDKSARSETVARSRGARGRRWARLSPRRGVQKPRVLKASANCKVREARTEGGEGLGRCRYACKVPPCSSFTSI